MTEHTTDADRTPVPELLREFKQVLDARMDVEAKRARSARRLAIFATMLAVLTLAATGGLLYYAFHQDLPVLTSPSVRAQEMVLVDAEGVERGSWRVDGTGTARFVLTDADGVDRLRLTLNETGEQGISLSDATGAVRLVISHLDDQSSTVAFADASGTTRAVMGMSGGEAASLLFADRNGGTRAALGMEATGEPVFWWPGFDGISTAAQP